MAETNSKTVLIRGILFTLFVFCLMTVGFKVAVTSVTAFGGDYYNYWQSGRAVFIHGVSPYDPSTTQIIQQGIYGGLARPEDDQLAFVYPPFSLILVLPVVGQSYAWAQAYWIAFNLVLVFIAALVLYKKPQFWWIASLVLFYPISRSVILGSFSLMIGAGCMLAYGLLNYKESPAQWKQYLAGLLLAWCAMKPQLSWIIIIFIILQSLQRREWSVLTGLAGGGLILAVISWILVPTWVSDWLNAIFNYVGYVPNQPIFINWINLLGIRWESPWVKLATTLIVVSGTLLILLYWWKGYFPDFLALGWLILINQLVNLNPYSMLSDQIVFLIPLILWMRRSDTNAWVRFLTWFSFVLIPWMLFAINFTGKEPYVVASGLALLYVVWWTAILINFLIKRRPLFENARITD
jgi:hypothetical protein